MIRVTLLCGRVLNGRALWRLLKFWKRSNATISVLRPRNAGIFVQLFLRFSGDFSAAKLAAQIAILHIAIWNFNTAIFLQVRFFGTLRVTEVSFSVTDGLNKSESVARRWLNAIFQHMVSGMTTSANNQQLTYEVVSEGVFAENSVKNQRKICTRTFYCIRDRLQKFCGKFVEVSRNLLHEPLPEWPRSELLKQFARLALAQRFLNGNCNFQNLTVNQNRLGNWYVPDSFVSPWSWNQKGGAAISANRMN